MTVLFLNAPGAEFHQRSSRWGGKVNRSGYLVPPIFLAIAAAHLREHGRKTRIIDAAALGWDGKELDRQLAEIRPRLTVIEASTISIRQDAETARRIREKYGGQVVMVGLHVSALPEESLREFPIDYICVGEYEDTILELAQALEGEGRLEKIAGLGWRDGEGRIRINPPRPLVDLDTLPIPMYSQLPLSKYWDPIARNHPCISIRTMRGCPFSCSYCVAPQVIYGGKVRYRDPTLVVKEVKTLIGMGVKEIFIDDETFTLSREHVLAICGKFKKAGIEIDWSCFGRVDRVDRGLLEEMKSAGCYMIRYGVESAERKILEAIGKGFAPEQTKRAFALTRSLGMKTHATVMYGSPGETKETMQRTLEFTLGLKPDYAQFTIVTPYPGTRYYREMEESGRLLSRDWEDYDGSSRMIVRLDSLAPGEVEAFVEHSYHRFYLRLGYFVRRLVGIRRRGELRYLLQSGSRFLRSLTPRKKYD